MIRFIYDAAAKKNHIKVTIEGKDIQPTLIKIEDTSNESILKTCQDWLNAFGIANTEYHVDVQLH